MRWKIVYKGKLLYHSNAPTRLLAKYDAEKHFHLGSNEGCNLIIIDTEKRKA